MDAPNFGKRSTHWPATMRAHLLKQPHCLCCGRNAKNVKLNVHHRFPFHYVVAVGRPDLELDQRNLYTLCVEHVEEHHLLVGHLDSFESFNPDLEHFLPLCRGLLAAQIRSLDVWIKCVAKRPKPLPQMTQMEKNALRMQLDRLMPALQKAT
jgi:hypothetical protein